MMKKQIAAILAGLLSIQLLAGCASAADFNVEDTLELTAGATLVSDDPADYENGEVFVLYQDGTSDLLAFSDEDALSAGLAELAADETVSLIQPNYTYENTGLTTNDALASQQWALSNDGSFQMESGQNTQPVYDDPFGQPSAPGQWQRPGGSLRPGNYFRSTESASTGSTQATAVAGIDINAEEGWDLYNSAESTREVVVALIDTGVDHTHEDLSGSIWVNDDEIPDNGIDDDGNGYVDDVYGWNFYSDNDQVYVGSEDSHGTHGAGTIAAASGNGIGISGIAQGDSIKVMILKALGGSDGSGTTASIIQAIQYAEANGAVICNLSLGTSSNDMALYRAIANSSMLFVVAAGNDSADIDASPSYPASYGLDNIISVANLSYDGTLHESSNYGSVSVDLAAPGSYILSTTPGDEYSYMTGTSMAAPMVTGAAAMAYSYFTDITLADVKEILLSSVQKLDSLSGKTVSGGMLDLGAALSYDLDDLSGNCWTVPENTSGSAPVIETQVVNQGGRTYLTVSIQDADNDLYLAAYAQGTLTAEQFAGGSAGTQFPLRSGSAVFSVSTSGTYTFYAVDSAGNETVKAVEVTVSEGGSQSPPAQFPSVQRPAYF